MSKYLNYLYIIIMYIKTYDSESRGLLEETASVPEHRLRQIPNLFIKFLLKVLGVS